MTETKDGQHIFSENEQVQEDLHANEANEQDNDGNSDATSATNHADVNNNTASAYHDTQRRSNRANETTDRNDTNNGGLGAGAGNSVSEKPV